MTRNITENPLINNVLYKQVAQKEDLSLIHIVTGSGASLKCSQKTTGSIPAVMMR